MFQKTEPLENLVDQFARFPGIGRKSAVRMAYQVMSMPAEQAMELAQAIEHAKKDLHRCRICQDFTTGDVCKICASQKRDRSVICVVESPRDIKAILRRTARDVIEGHANPASDPAGRGVAAGLGEDGATGAGLVDADAALQQLG